MRFATDRDPFNSEDRDVEPVSFVVQGLPPKKDGSTSMWNKPLERTRLIALRCATLEAQGAQAPSTCSFSLTLEVHVGPVNTRAIGDLDNFITGVCDGLQAAAGNSIGIEWEAPELALIHPSRAIAFVDDVHAVSIVARKVIADEAPWYRVTLEPA